METNHLQQDKILNYTSLYDQNSKVDYVSEPKEQWGGSWTEQKLDAFAKYVKAYLTIMNSHRDKYNWKLIYFDGFAGSGTREGNKNCEEINKTLFDLSEIEETECNVYIGAAERVASLNDIRGFDYYYFNEKDEDSCESLREKLSKYESNGKRFVFRSKDANEEVKNLANAHLQNNKLKSLVLLDPFGMQLNWESISTLKKCSSDVWILLPSGAIINRLLDGNGNLKFSPKLQKFFGMSENEIKNFFYANKTEKTLFGEEERLQKLPNAIPRIAELYVKRLKDIFEFVTEKPLILYNTRGTPIFHFVFASNNATATKIASEIVGYKRKNS